MFILITAAVVIVGSLGVAALVDLRNGRASGHLDPTDAAQIRDERSEAEAAARAAGMHRGGGASI